MRDCREFVSLSDVIFTPLFFLPLPLNCALPIHFFLCISIALSFPVWHSCYILHFCFKSRSFFPFSAKVKHAGILKQPYLLPVVRRYESAHQGDNGWSKFCSILLMFMCNRELLSATHAEAHIHTHSRCIAPILVLWRASLDSVVGATRLPGLSCQDLTCVPEDKAITGGRVADGVLKQTHTVTSRCLGILCRLLCECVLVQFHDDAG